MVLNGFWYVFLSGVFGGFLGELLKWYRLREEPELPHYVRSPFYWCVTLLLILAGGALAVFYGTKDVNALMAANIGLSAPLIIQSLSRTFGATHINSKLQDSDHPPHRDHSESVSRLPGDTGMAEYDPDAFGASEGLGAESTIAEKIERTLDPNRSSQWAMFCRFLAG